MNSCQTANDYNNREQKVPHRTLKCAIYTRTHPGTQARHNEVRL